MKNIFFSIIIPTYNRAEFLSKTITSLLNQKYQHFEVIVIDDGSTDETNKVINNINDPKVKYYYQDNKERGAARNYGIQKAQGDYINFFDSDDIAYDNHLITASKILSENNYDIIHLGHHKILNKKIIKKNNPSGLLNRKILFGNIMLPISTFIKKNILENNKFNTDKEIAGSEDYLFWLNLSKKFKIYGFSNITSALIIHPRRSMITTTAIKTEKRVIKLLSFIELSSLFTKNDINKIKANCYIFIALEFSIEKNKKKAIKYLRYTISQYPLFIFSIRFFVILKNIVF